MLKHGVASARERLPVGLKPPSPLRIVLIKAQQKTPLYGESFVVLSPAS